MNLDLEKEYKKANIRREHVIETNREYSSQKLKDSLRHGGRLVGNV